MKRIYYFLLLWAFCLFCAISSFAKVADSTMSQTYVRSVIFTGNKITKDFVIKREMNFGEGDFIPTNNINDVLEYNRERILNCRLFVSVKADIIYNNNDTVDIEFILKELFFWQVYPFVSLADRNFNVWWDDYDHKLNRVNIGGDITRTNFRGRGEEIGIEVQAGFNKHIYLYYSNPYIDKTLKNGISASLAYNTGKEIQAQTDSNKQVFFRDENRNPYRWLRGEFAYLYRPAYAATHEVRFAFHHYSITQNMFDMQPDFLGGKRKMNIPELMYRFKYNNTDDRNYPTWGWEIETFLENKGLGLVKGFNQSQLYAHVVRFQPIRRNLSAALHLRGRIYSPDKQPYFNYRAMGYNNDYVRGYEYYIIDGSHYGLLRADIRQRVLHYTVRQKILPILNTVPINCYLKAYSDAGYVHSNNFGNSFLNNRLLTSYGLGLDLIFSYYIKVRIEYSINSLNQKGLFLHLRNE